MNLLLEKPDIPEDLIIEILSRLPVRSLLRCRCVCKPWCSLISDPKFSLSATTTRHRVIIRTLGLYSYSIDDGEASPRVLFDKLWNPYSEEMPYSLFYIFGSCNGLLLVSNSLYSFHLWNPSTRQCVKVLGLELEWQWSRYLYDINFSSDNIGFCYGSSTDDYKVVMVHDEVALVASFKTKHCARISFPCGGAKLKSGPVVNGRSHWSVAHTKKGSAFPTHQIVCFDPLTDEFVEVPTPLPYNGKENTILGLGVLDGCLCMVHWDLESGVEGNIEVLVMKEYGMEESWTSMFIWILPLRCCRDLMPLCFTKNGEVLMAINRKQIFVYNPKKNKRRDIPIPNNGYDRDTAVSVYVESLVSLATYEQEGDWRDEMLKVVRDFIRLVERKESSCFGWE